MKLDFESIYTSLKPYRLVIIAGALFLVLLVFGWMFTGLGDWWFGHGVKKDKEEIKKEVNQLANIDKEIANLATKREIQKEKIKEAANGFAESVNATDQARAVTNQAIANMVNASAANQGNVNASDLDGLLDRLK